MPDVADASPTKKFFIEMLTRDIPLEDAILDLLDNCIDSLSRTRRLPLSEALLEPKAVQKAATAFREQGIPRVDITIDESSFTIDDNCGGITYESARKEVFRFGRVAEPEKSRLSVYGIGLKRAVFKLGREITVESKTVEDGFVVKIDVDQWAGDNEWVFPIERTSPAKSADRAGTRVLVRRLNPETKLRIHDGQLIPRLSEFISTTYSLLLGRFLVVRLNGHRIDAQRIPMGASTQVTPGRAQFDVGNVTVTLLAGLAERIDGEWTAESAGWYVLCNGRVVVFPDKTDLTGWGIATAEFVSKYRGFVGIAFFFSEDPEALPWTTTKRGLNKDSRAYLAVRNRMSVIARPVLGFLNKMYASGEPEEPAERQIANTVKSAEIVDLLKTSSGQFEVRTSTQKVHPDFVSIQYKVPIADLERVRKHLRRTRWSASRIGQHTFDYFVQHECPS